MKHRLALVLVCFGVSLEARCDDEETFSAAKFIGRWEVTKCESGAVPEGTTVEFLTENKLKVTVTIGGQTTTFDGSYEVKEDKVTCAIESATGQEVSDTDTIRTLNGQMIVLVDKDKKVTEFKKKK